VEPPDFCREIESYLCRKNDGHLIRVVGPSFELVAGWARLGVPIKVAFAGIDRYFERYYRGGPRRRPVKIDFCEADVLNVFDEWKRATGVVGGQQSAAVGSHQAAVGRQSLPEHLERVVTRLTSARAAGSIDETFDAIIDRVSADLDVARAKSGGVRGDERSRLLDRLAAIDGDMLALARARVDSAALDQLGREADEELSSFRAGMASDAYARAHEAAVGHLLRARLNLPTIAFH